MAFSFHKPFIEESTESQRHRPVEYFCRSNSCIVSFHRMFIRKTGTEFIKLKPLWQKIKKLLINFALLTFQFWLNILLVHSYSKQCIQLIHCWHKLFFFVYVSLSTEAFHIFSTLLVSTKREKEKSILFRLNSFITVCVSVVETAWL